MIVDPLTFRLPRTPAFIAFEGINGCGKTTLQRNLQQRLEQGGASVVATREPGGTPLGLELRKLLLDWRGEQKSPRAELLLFAADRAEHVDTVIKPGLANKSWVLCDRYLFSTVAFQGYGRGLDAGWIDEANHLATQGLLPDLVILMDLDPVEGVRRTKARQDESRDAFEEEQSAFHTRIREGFLKCAENSPAPFLVLDATQSKEANLAAAAKALGV